MTLETDLLVDRRRLKRRLLLWRTAAVIAVLACAMLLLGRGALPVNRPSVARVTINGLITEQRKLTEAVAALADDDETKALIVAIDSPGGSVAGGEEFYSAIARVEVTARRLGFMGSSL